MSSNLDTSWFGTTPESLLRAESVLVAFRENRINDIATTLAHDQDRTTEPLELVVALIVMADRLADYGARLHSAEHGETDRTVLIAEARRKIAEVVIAQTNSNDD